jgi:flagellar hook protein FlgE
VTIGQLVTAKFSNASGLEKLGDNLFGQTLNSGDVILETIDAAGETISSGVVEMSNVDLATEFTDMIVTQRGFQANSRVITTSDTMIEELLSLKR